MKRTLGLGWVDRLFIAIITCVCCVQSLPAQEMSHPISLSGGDSFFRTYRSHNAPDLPDTVRTLALMVQFQADDDSRTTGNGQFDLSNGYQDTVIDSPPHDRSYFQNHLLFLENYFKKVSDGKLVVRSEVFDSVITLPNKMQAYSPSRNATNEPLGRLMQDAWRLADSANPSLDFSRFDFFVIFHAGAGHDIDLVSLYGYDPTPFDVPSLYMGLSSLKDLFGSGYSGIPVNGGRFLIANSAILPETESRDVQSAFGTSRLELSINGLLAANLGSFLGLPDLFDTKTGRTAVGRFGLMDGQSIFSFNGLFPPELSAWEKIFLGWVQPVTVQSGASNLTVAAHRTDGLPNTNAIYKVPISAREYFLLEGRFRDPGLNGQRLKTAVGGRAIEKGFLTDTLGFNETNTTRIDGVVTDVEDIDWSLPSGISERGDTLRGGILIWHIDENVIEAGLATNTVNTDPNHRGVSLVQANGAQDIGQTIHTILGDVIGEGTALDYWFQENPSPVYKNEFTSTSFPNSKSYSGANSHIFISDFSKQSPVMTCRVQIGDGNVKPLPGFPKYVGQVHEHEAPTHGSLNADVNEEIILNASGQLYAFTTSGLSLLNNSTGLFSTFGGKFQPAVVSSGPTVSVIGVGDSTIYMFKVSDSNNDGLADTLFSVKLKDKISTPPLLHNGRIYVGGSSGRVYVVNDRGILDTAVYVLSAAPGYPVSALVSADSVWVATAGKEVFASNGRRWKFEDDIISCAAGDLDGNQIPDIAVQTVWNEISVFNINEQNYRSFSPKRRIGNDYPSRDPHPVIADINGDGLREAIAWDFDKTYALNYSGAVVDNFPISRSDSVFFGGSPVVGDVDGDGKQELVISTLDGQIFAYKSDGQVAQGFPLATGKAVVSSPLLFVDATGRMLLFACCTDGYVYGWDLGGSRTQASVQWGNLLHDPYHANCSNSVIGSRVPKPFADLVPQSQAYNWPNPVYGSTTKIRYYLTSSSAISIKIFDLAGEKVDEISAGGTGGIDNEVEWNVSNVQSGVYIARIEAKTTSSTGVAFIKIAVVH
jgi:hypothetical protein